MTSIGAAYASDGAPVVAAHEARAHRSPSLASYFAEQVRVVGKAVRREGSLLVVGLFVFFAFVVAFALRVNEALGFDGYGDLGALSMTAAFGALFAPLAVWKGEPRFGAGPIWLQPMHHRSAALAKVAAGWVWTMAVVAVLLVLVIAVSVSTGATFASDEILWLAPTMEIAQVSPVRWSVRWWQLATLFTAPTLAYLATSALMLGARHPGRWVAGAAMAFFGLVGFAEMASAPRIAWAMNSAMETILFGPLGLDAILTAGVESFDELLPLSADRRLHVQTALPTAQRWFAATAVWAAGLLTALFAAASRSRG